MPCDLSQSGIENFCQRVNFRNHFEGLGDFFDLRTWVLALLGSLILLGVYRLVARRRGVRT